MIKNLTMDELFPLICEALSSGASISFIPNGTSMLPFIRPGRDSVTLSPLPETLSFGDIVLYRRSSGQNIMHRIIGKDKEGYIFCGDNQVTSEKGISRDMMTAIVSSVCRDGETVDLENDKDYLSYKKRTVLKKRVQCFVTHCKGAVKKLLGK